MKRHHFVVLQHARLRHWVILEIFFVTAGVPSSITPSILTPTILASFCSGTGADESLSLSLRAVEEAQLWLLHNFEPLLSGERRRLSVLDGAAAALFGRYLRGSAQALAVPPAETTTQTDGQRKNASNRLAME